MTIHATATNYARQLIMLVIATATIALSGYFATAEEVISISTTIKGNQEHPGVTYIIPWRRAGSDAAVAGSFNNSTRLNEVFDHVEKVEHEREVDYLVQMQRQTGSSVP